MDYKKEKKMARYTGPSWKQSRRLKFSVLENNVNWLLFSSERLKKLIFGKLTVGKTVSFLFFIYLCRKNYWFNET